MIKARKFTKKRDHMTLKSTLRNALFISSSLWLSACGVPGSGNSNDFNDPNRGNTDPESEFVSVSVTVEGTARMLNRSSSSANIITADDIDCDAISVVQLGFDFSDLGSAPDIPDFTPKTRSGFGKEDIPGCKLEFVSNFEPRADAVVKVDYPNGDILYAPLRRTESEDQSITVSFGTHLTLERFFAQLSSSIDLARHLPCSGSTPNCETQHKAKARLLSFMAETARLYEFKDDVTSIQTATEALAKLRTKSDLMTHIETAVLEITRSESPIAKGTLREYDITENPDIQNGSLQTRLRPSDTYNSVLFAMGFIADGPSDGQEETSENKLMTASSHIASGDGENTLPTLIHNAYYLDFRYDDILPNIPFEMASMRFKTNLSSFDVNPSLPENRYSYLTSQDDGDGTLVNGTHLNSQGFFLNDRAIAQTLTVEPVNAGEKGVGFDFNPVYYKLYRLNEYEPDTTLDSFITPQEPDYGLSPTWFTGTGYGLINVFEIEKTSSDTSPLERDGLLEEHRYFSWEVHGLRTPNTFSENKIKGTYDVLEFSIDMDENSSNDEPILVRAEASRWATDTSGGSPFSETQPTIGNFYTTSEIARDKNNNFVSRLNTVRAPTSGPGTTRNFNLYKDDDKPNGLVYLGSGARSRIPLGHVSENGNHLAFAIDTSKNNGSKRGLILASKRRTNEITLTPGSPLEFTLSGNYFFMDSDTHKMASLNESRLTISVPSGGEDCDARLSINSTAVTHSLNSTPESVISDPVSTVVGPTDSTSCTLSDGRMELTFMVDSSTVTLRGFAMQEDGALGRTVKQANLLWIQNNALGLVFAQLDQGLGAEFDE